MRLLDSILVEEQFSLARSPKPGETCTLRANFNFEFFPQQEKVQQVKLNFLLDMLGSTDQSVIGNVTLKTLYIVKLDDEELEREQVVAFLRDSIKSSIVMELNQLFVRAKLSPVYITNLFPENQKISGFEENN